MHINTFDHYQHTDSLIHRLDPRVKLAATVLLIFSNVLLPDGAWLGFFLAWVFVVIVSYLAKLSLIFLLTRALVALPFALAAVTAIFTIPGEPAAAIQVGPWLVVATWAGLIRFASIMLRSWVSIQAAIILTASTHFPDLVHAMRHLKLPDILVSVISFMYRYLFVLADEVVRMLRARESRSAAVPGKRSGGKVLWRVQTAGNMAGQLFLRSYERSDRVYNAMLSRGYEGVMMTIRPHHIQRVDWIAGGVCVLTIAVLQLLSRI